MDHYKSWSGLNKWLYKWLCECLCEELKGRITYFLTRYHKVHDSYGRAAILLDGKELVCFSWIEQYRQEQQVSAMSVQDALNSEDYIIKILAILDKRVGKRTLQKIQEPQRNFDLSFWGFGVI